MKRGGVAAAIGAIGSSLASMACCWPIGALGAAGVTAGLAAALQAGRPWLLVLALGSLGLGIAQAIRARRCGARASRLGVALLAVAVVVVLLVTLFPQVMASWLAGLGETE